MFESIKRLLGFGRKQEFSEERWNQHYEAKKDAFERILGPMDEVVGHAVIPFAVGGAVDMYYFSSHIAGTVFATMELINPDGKGLRPNRMGTYELVACTRLKRPVIDTPRPMATNEESELPPFVKQERRICGMLTSIGRYSFHAVLQPGETCEVPGDEEDERICMVFDEFDTKGVAFEIEGEKHGLLLCIEVHPLELNYAREVGAEAVIAKLKEAGFYPYSDLDREPVI